jgi:predicted lipid-binding transport protein (Tim44 family)
MFDVMMREGQDRVSNQVRELWHFSRDSARPDSFWTLEGIQQIE